MAAPQRVWLPYLKAEQKDTKLIHSTAGAGVTGPKGVHDGDDHGDGDSDDEMMYNHNGTHAYAPTIYNFLIGFSFCAQAPP